MPEIVWAAMFMPVAVGLLLSFLLELLLKPSPVISWQRPVAALLLHIGSFLLLYGSLLLLLRRPWFSVALLLVFLLLLILINNAKYHSLRESFIYQDFSYFVDALRYPRLYLPFLGVWSGVSLMLVVVAALVSGLLLEDPYSIASIGLTGTVAALGGALLLLLGGSIPVLLQLDPDLDLKQLGLLACLWLYALNELQDWPGNANSCFNQAVLKQAASVLPNLAVIQSESFFDPRRWYDGITPDLLQHFDDLKRSSVGFGQLDVPAWGANTVRTEFAFLAGIANEQLGVHRFKPYRRVARQGLPTLPSYLKKLGYRTICLHPYSSGFYDRETVFPLLGFDEFIDISRFRSEDYNGQYVGDLAVARELCTELAKHDSPDAQPLFIFVITMENHGPLHLEQARAEDRQCFVTQSLPDGADDLIVYLRHLEQADQMLGVVKEQLTAMQRVGWLCLYGDHLPIMPQVYQQLGEPDGTVDYLIWGNRKQQAGNNEARMGVEQLGTLLLQRAGLGATSQPGNPV